MSAVLAALIVGLVVIGAGLPLGHFMYPPPLRRRERARVAERAARPVVDPAAAVRDAAATLRARITEER